MCWSRFWGCSYSICCWCGGQGCESRSFSSCCWCGDQAGAVIAVTSVVDVVVKVVEVVVVAAVVNVVVVVVTGLVNGYCVVVACESNCQIIVFQF